MLAQQLFNALVLGAVYALFSMGFTLTFGVLRVINLLYGFYVAAGAFLSLLAVRGLGLPLWLAAVFGALGTGVVALACDTILLTPLRRNKAREPARDAGWSASAQQPHVPRLRRRGAALSGRSPEPGADQPGVVADRRDP